MLTEPLFFVGLGVGALGVSAALIRGLHGSAQALVLAGGVALVIAGAALIGIAREKHRFRVTEVELVAERDYAGRCPGEHRVHVRVSTAGGEGEVAVRVWADEDYDAPLRRVRVKADTAFELLTTVQAARTGYSTAYASVEAPNYEVASTPYEVACSERAS